MDLQRKFASLHKYSKQTLIALLCATLSLLTLSAPSASATTPLGTPTGVTSLPASDTTVSVSFTPADANATSFTVKTYNSVGDTLLLTQGGFTTSPALVTGLSAGTDYKVTVTAIGDGATFSDSLESTQADVTT